MQKIFHAFAVWIPMHTNVYTHMDMRVLFYLTDTLLILKVDHWFSSQNGYEISLRNKIKDHMLIDKRSDRLEIIKNYDLDILDVITVKDPLLAMIIYFMGETI